MKKVIKASPKDRIVFNRYNKTWLINDKEYPSDKYKISLDKRLDLTSELKALANIEKLKKKLITHFNNLELLRDYKRYDKDKATQKERSINKGKQIIKKYLSELKADTNFKLIRRQHDIFLGYKGEFVTAQKVVAL